MKLILFIRKYMIFIIKRLNQFSVLFYFNSNFDL